MKFSWKEIEEKSKETGFSSSLLETGIYDVSVLKAVDGVTKSGETCIIIQCFSVKLQDREVIIESVNKNTGESYGVYWITSSPYFFKKNIFALGLRDKYDATAASQTGEGEITALDIVGKEAKAIITTSKTLKKNGEGFYTKNKVAELLANWDRPEERLQYWRAMNAKESSQFSVNQLDHWRSAEAKGPTPLGAPPANGSIPVANKLNDEVPF